jgi:Ca-activated chloride channel family protein
VNKNRLAICCAALLLVLFLSPSLPALADGIIIPEPPPTVPIVEVPYLTVKYHHVTVTIDDQVATTHVDQVFVNEGRHEVEGTYLFPLPEQAAISQFTMWVDGQKMDGQVLERDEARAIYEDIVRKRRDPALLEYVGRNTFQASIFPIPPGAERRIELEYSQVLPMDNGLVQYVYPLNTEKFSARPLDDVSVTVTIKSQQALKAIYSPSHDVDVVRDGDYAATVGYEESDVKPDRDFVLYYSVSAEDVGLSLLSYKPDAAGDGFFLLLAAPKVSVESQQVVAKDVIVVLDVSGSMQGEKLDQAKQALKFVLHNLNDEDRFDVIAFSTSTHAYSRGLVPASERGEARDFVDRLQANGSTDINRVLLEALSMADGSRPTILIFLTDGQPTAGEIDVDRILKNAGDSAPDSVRVFPFGLGYDVNTVLLDSLAEAHGGASGYVRPSEKIDEHVSAFYAKVSTPLLSNVAVDWGGIEVEDVYPYPLPDLFAGSQLVVVGRYRDGGPSTLTLSGEVNGQPAKFEYGDVTFSQEGGAAFISRLWATRKIGYLLQQIRLHGEDKEVVDEIVDLSVRYGIITPYTSFLVLETEQALSSAGREDLANQMTAVPLGLSGEAAVDRSLQEKALSGAAAVPAPTMGAGEGAPADAHGDAVTPIKYVGDKTFILNEGTWTDTTFDPDTMKAVPVEFGSDDYFKLAAARPEWGQYLAAGEHEIVVLDGTAYEVRAGAAPALVVPGDQAPGAAESILDQVVQAVIDAVERIVDWLREL